MMQIKIALRVIHKFSYSLFLGLILMGLISPMVQAKPKNLVTIGYANLEPYTYVEVENDGFHHLEGLDVSLFHLIFNHAQYEIKFKELPQADIMSQIQNGDIDIASTMNKTLADQRYVYYSEPYRTARDSLYMRSEDIKRFHFRGVKHFFASAAVHGNFKFGVVRGQNFSDDTITTFFASDEGSKHIVYAHDQMDNLNNLLNGKVDAFFANEIGIENLIWVNKLRERVKMYPLTLKSKPVYLMFSRKTMQKSDVDKFNLSLMHLRGNGKFQQIMRKHIVPMMIAIMTETTWYHVAELLGVISFAISGVLLAKRAQFDFFGTLIISSLPSSAGGIMRDVMLNRAPIGILRTPMYLITIICTVASLFILVKLFFAFKNLKIVNKYFHHFSTTEVPPLINYVKYSDGFAQSAFVVTGVMVCVEAHATPLWLWGPIFATLSSCGGGIIRDFILGVGFNRNFLYETLAFWGCALSTFIIFRTEYLNLSEVLFAVTTCMIGLITTRMLCIKFAWRSNNFWQGLFTKN